MLKWFKNIRDNVEWSRSKGLVVYGPEIFGHHFIYIDSNFKVAIILPKADETLHILIGDPVRADRWLKFNSEGKELFDKPLNGNEYEWKIDKDKIRYRGTALKPTGPGHKGKVIKSFEFNKNIDEGWIKQKKKGMYQIYKKGELPVTTNW